MSGLVWYDIHEDEIFMNWVLDAMFYSLAVVGVDKPDWSRYELLGQLYWQDEQEK